MREHLTCEAFQCPSADNTHLNKAYLAAMAEALGGQRLAAEYKAEFVDNFRVVFGGTCARPRLLE